MASKPFSYKFDHIDFVKLTPRLKKELLRAVTQFGKRASGKGALGLQRHLQRSSSYDGNNPWWRKAKHNKRVFYDSGYWRKQASYKVLPAAGDILASVEVGFVNKSPHPSERQSGNMDVQRIAKILAGGKTWTPTPAQRQGFWRTIRRRGVKINQKKIEPRAEYRTPKRDFVKEHLDTPKVKRLFMQLIDKAVAHALKSTPRKKGPK